MSGYRFSPEALEDLWEIWNYIGVENENPEAADRLWAEIDRACEALSKRPALGHRRKDLTADPDVLFYCVHDHYLVIYRKGTEPLEIARVLHGARDVEDELEK